MTAVNKPAHATEEMLSYLDELRESGKVNMYAAAPHIEQKFTLTMTEARQALAYWMKTYNQKKATKGSLSF